MARVQSFSSIVKLGGRSDSFDGPFSIQNGSTSDSVKINYYSSLLVSENPDDKIIIIGLNADIVITGVGYIWLDVNLTDLENITADINNGTDGWPGFPSATEYLEGTQIHAYILIATIVDSSKIPTVRGISVNTKPPEEGVSSKSYIAYRHLYQDLTLITFCNRVVLWPVGAALI